MNAHQLRSWLLQQPRAAELRVQIGKDKNTVSVSGQSWAKLASTLQAMQADRIDAVDGGGNILRSVRPADVDDEDEAKPEAAPATTPSGLPAQAYDPETVRFELVAKLLSDAHRFSTGVAWDKMVEIVNAISKRGEALERALERTERLLHRHAEDLLTEAEEKAAEAGADPLKDMAAAFMGSMGGDLVNGKTKATTNGKG